MGKTGDKVTLFSRNTDTMSEARTHVPNVLCFVPILIGYYASGFANGVHDIIETG